MGCSSQQPGGRVGEEIDEDPELKGYFERLKRR
jgi:hypothetical protein